MVISPISTSCGCSMANATALATASGEMPKSSMVRRIWARSAGSSMESSSSVRTNPGEIEVVRMTPSVDSWRRPSRQCAHGVLRRGVDGHVGHDLQPGRRHRGDEMAAALPPEHRHRRGDAVQHAAQVDVDHRRPAVDVAVRDGPDLADSGVAHQHVEPAELVDRGPISPSRSSRLVTSVALVTTAAPLDRSSSAMRSSRSVRRAPRTSAAPRAASSRAVASPIPLLAPVTAMTVPGRMPGSRS